MNPHSEIPRREFLSHITVAGAAMSLPRIGVSAATATVKRWPVIFFTKAVQELKFDYEQTASLAAEMGWDGIECPVRKGGQVLPERVEDDLPRMVEALRKHGRELTMMTTDIRDTADPLTGRVLRTASRLGIRYYRLGWFKYRRDQSIPDQLKALKPRLKDLAALNQELGIRGGIQNHSGPDYVGAPVWDLHALLQDINPLHLGVCFDIGHATVEGGYAWPTHAQLMEPHFGSVYVKDFLWQKGPKGWSVKWGPLGGGTIQPAFFEWLRKSSFNGPVSLHVEYPMGTGDQVKATLRKDTATLKAWLQG